MCLLHNHYTLPFTRKNRACHRFPDANCRSRFLYDHRVLLKKYKKAEYTILFIDNKLIDHLEEVQEAATKRVEEIIKSLKEQSNLKEEMKNTDQLYWVGMMNNFKNQAEEVVFKELIYV